MPGGREWPGKPFSGPVRGWTGPDQGLPLWICVTETVKLPVSELI